jgi:hypothetical protein
MSTNQAQQLLQDAANGSALRVVIQRIAAKAQQRNARVGYNLDGGTFMLITPGVIVIDSDDARELFEVLAQAVAAK